MNEATSTHEAEGGQTQKAPTENSLSELRVKVAELCGWRFVVHPTTGIGGYWERGMQGREGYERGDWGSRELAIGLPDYPHDLNACAEFEKMLTAEQRRKYVSRLLCEVSEAVPYWGCINATAPQRFRAFIAVMEEEEK